MVWLAALLAAWLFLFSGCEENPTEIEDYDPQPKLTAYLYNGIPVEEVILERIASLYSYYDPADHYIADAEIILFPLDNPSPGDTLFFVDSTATRGVYLPAPGQADLIPQGGARYRIEARKPSENLYLWAETVVPDTFTLAVNDTVILTKDTNPDTFLGTYSWNSPTIHFDWSKSDSTGCYVFNAICMEEDTLIHLDPDFELDDDEDPDYVSQHSLNILMDYVFSMDALWIYFSWVGSHRIVFQACSPDYREYLFSIFRVQQGMMEDVIYNVHGGLGVFAGFCRVSFTMEMERVQ